MIKLRRAVAVVVWTAGAFWAWLLALYCGAQFLFLAQQRLQLSPLSRALPEWQFALLLWVIGGFGTIVVTVGALILAIRGQLPGTRKGGAQLHGFPLKQDYRDMSDSSVQE